VLPNTYSGATVTIGANAPIAAQGGAATRAKGLTSQPIEEVSMAENDDTGGDVGGNDLRVEMSTLLFELRVALEAAAVGIKRIIDRPLATSIRDELSILFRLVEQGAEALNALDGVLEDFLRRRTDGQSNR
jgi:hypothetical protein